jgi:hypothetical protein
MQALRASKALPRPQITRPGLKVNNAPRPMNNTGRQMKMHMNALPGALCLCATGVTSAMQRNEPSCVRLE